MAYDLSEFTSTELIDGSVQRNTRTFGSALPFVQDVAENGRDHDALTLVGWFRPTQGGEKNVPVYVPWFVFDVDRDSESLGMAYDDTVRLLMRVEEAGVDLNRCAVSFSGRRGFHVHMDASMWGNPIFENHVHARSTLGKIMSALAGDVEVDDCVWNPVRAIRITGATHGTSKGRKFTLPAYEFIAAPSKVQTMISEAQAGTYPTKWTWPDPRDGEPMEALVKHMTEAWRSVKENRDANAQTKRASKRDGVMPYPIYKAWQGVQKSSPFAFGFVGRDNAAFLIACHFLRQGCTPEHTLRLLQKWDAERNMPPLQDDTDEPVDVLERKVESAMEKLYEDGQIDQLNPLP